MTKLIILSILLLLVYQLDEVVRITRSVFRRNKKFYSTNHDGDYNVGTVLTIAGMPLILNYLVVSDQPLQLKLIIVGVMLFMFSVLASGMEIFMRRLNEVSYHHNVNAFAGMLYATAGLFQPVLRTIPWHTGRARKDLAKLAFMLSLPVIAAIVIRNYYTSNYAAEFEKYLDVLILVMIGGVFMNIVIKFLERFFRNHHFNMLGYVRVLAGVVISLYLIL